MVSKWCKIDFATIHSRDLTPPSSYGRKHFPFKEKTGYIGTPHPPSLLGQHQVDSVEAIRSRAGCPGVAAVAGLRQPRGQPLHLAGPAAADLRPARGPLRGGRGEGQRRETSGGKPAEGNQMDEIRLPHNETTGDDDEMMRMMMQMRNDDDMGDETTNLGWCLQAGESQGFLGGAKWVSSMRSGGLPTKNQERSDSEYSIS